MKNNQKNILIRMFTITIITTAIIIYRFLFLNFYIYFLGSVYPVYIYYYCYTVFPLNNVLYKFIPFYIYFNVSFVPSLIYFHVLLYTVDFNAKLFKNTIFPYAFNYVLLFYYFILYNSYT